MIQYLEWLMPYVLTVIYLFMAIIYLISGKYGPLIYWTGAMILNIGILIMSRTSI